MEEDIDIKNERDFIKGALTALSEVLNILADMEEAEKKKIEMKVVDLYDRILNGYLDITEPEWADVLRTLSR